MEIQTELWDIWFGTRAINQQIVLIVKWLSRLLRYYFVSELFHFVLRDLLLSTINERWRTDGKILKRFQRKEEKLATSQEQHQPDTRRLPVVCLEVVQNETPKKIHFVESYSFDGEEKSSLWKAQIGRQCRTKYLKKEELRNVTQKVIFRNF